MDESAVKDAHKFQPGRPRTAYMHFGYGPHECLGREVAIAYVTSMIKVCAKLENLRRAPGPMGICKHITIRNERCYLNDSWSYLTFDPTTWKLHFDGVGRGVYSPPKHLLDPEFDLDVIKRDIKRMHKRRKEVAAAAIAGAAGALVGGGSSKGDGHKDVEQTTAWTFTSNGSSGSESDSHHHHHRDHHHDVRTQYSFEQQDGHTSVERVEAYSLSEKVEETEAVSINGGPWKMTHGQR